MTKQTAREIKGIIEGKKKGDYNAHDLGIKIPHGDGLIIPSHPRFT